MDWYIITFNQTSEVVGMDISGTSQVSPAYLTQSILETHESTIAGKALDQQVADGVASLKLIQSANVSQANGRVGNNLNVVV